MMAEKSAAEQLREYLQGKALIMGIGNPLRGDDGAGPRLIESLRESGSKSLLIDAGSAPERHLGEVKAAAPECVLLVDAVDFGGNPGEVRLFSREELGDWRPLSTHRLPLRLVMEYLEEETKARVLLLGIQPHLESFGQCLSVPVRQTVEALAVLLKMLPSAETTEACLLSTTARTEKEKGL